MSDYLKNLVERTLDPSRVVQPRLASRFEPQAGTHGTFAAFDVETDDEASPAAPSVEARTETRRTHVTTQADGAPRAQSEHLPAPVDERRPDFSPRAPRPAPMSERAPGPPLTSQTFVNKETPGPAGVTVEAGKGAAREETSRQVSDAAREPRPPAESVMTQTPRVAPRVVEPRLSPVLRVSEVQPPIAPDDARLDEEAPTIRVTIGRVDVRAVAAPAKEARRAPEPPRPALTLEDYLRRRGGGSR